MTITRTNPATVRAPMGYAHAVEVVNPSRRVAIAGQVGMRLDGTIPDTPEGQIAQCFDNFEAVLASVGMTAANLVKITVFLTDRAHLAMMRAERAKRLAGTEVPASTLLFVSGLADERYIMEIEGEAAA